jgi:hypothetical protein
MDRVEEIESAIENLPPEDFTRIARMGFYASGPRLSELACDSAVLGSVACAASR